MKQLNILILDDEQMLLDLLTMMLRPHSSSVCLSLVDAQNLIESQSEVFDVMLCDVMMPKGGGVDLYDWLIENHPALVNRLLFVTGGVGQEIMQKIERTGLPILHKPFSIAQLHECLNRFQ